MSIEEYWNRLGKPKTIYDPQQIEKFLNVFIKKTNGNLNLDTIHNYDFSDSIVKIERNESLFKIYWKDYEQVINKHLSHSATEDEIDEVMIFGGFTFIYYLMDIHKISIDNLHGGVYVIIHCNYLPEKAAIKHLKKNFKFVNDPYTVSEDNATRKKIYFSDSNNYTHECVIDVLPISNSIIFQKIKPWNTSFSHKLLTRAALIEIINPVYNNKQLFSSLNNDNEDKIRSMINDLRYSLEGLIKFYFITEAIKNEWNGLDLESSDSIIVDILQKFGYSTLIKFKKPLKLKGINLDQSFINELNKYSHYSGYFPTKSILLQCHKNYCEILEELFDLAEYGINIEALTICKEGVSKT